MTEEQLLQAIRNSFCDVYCVHYIGPLKLNKLYNHGCEVPIEHIGYSVEIGILNKQKPITIAAEIIDGDKFLAFFKEELRLRRLDEVLHECAHYIPPYECPVDRSCKCK